MLIASIAFYHDVLGLRRDEHADYQCWAGDTCLAIWTRYAVRHPLAR